MGRWKKIVRQKIEKFANQQCTSLISKINCPALHTIQDTTRVRLLIYVSGSCPLFVILPSISMK